MMADALKVNQSLQNLRSATTEYSMIQYKSKKTHSTSQKMKNQVEMPLSILSPIPSYIL